MVVSEDVLLLLDKNPGGKFGVVDTFVFATELPNVPLKSDAVSNKT
jgi:hypothetical protein